MKLTDAQRSYLEATARRHDIPFPSKAKHGGSRRCIRNLEQMGLVAIKDGMVTATPSGRALLKETE